MVCMMTYLEQYIKRRKEGLKEESGQIISLSIFADVVILYMKDSGLYKIFISNKHIQKAQR